MRQYLLTGCHPVSLELRSCPQQGNIQSGALEVWNKYGNFLLAHFVQLYIFAELCSTCKGMRQLQALRGGHLSAM